MAEDRKFRWDEDGGQFVNRVSGEAIPDDEPVIIFRARDTHTLPILRLYQDLVVDPHHQRAVQDRIDEFSAFQEANPNRLKEPGITRHIRLNSDATRPPTAAGPGVENLVEALSAVLHRVDESYRVYDITWASEDALVFQRAHKALARHTEGASK